MFALEIMYRQLHVNYYKHSINALLNEMRRNSSNKIGMGGYKSRISKSVSIVIIYLLRTVILTISGIT